MEKKIGLIFILGVLSAIIMFNSISTNEIDYLAIGDSLALNNDRTFNDLFYESYKKEINSYNASYTINNLSARDLYDLINFNEVYGNNELTIKQLINQSEVIVLSIGTDEINNGGNINLYIYYMDLVLNEISKINDNTVYVVGLYLMGDSINNELTNLCTKYDFEFVSINDLVSESYLIKESYLPSSETQNLIGETLINKYEKSKKTS